MTQTEATSRAARYSGRLKRLDASFYRGQSYVHWTFSIQGRKTGWLCPEHEADLLSAMRDWLVRYHLCCYAYCLMPDHGHFLLIGLNDRSDQQAFVREFTRSWNQLLRPLQLARQAYDTVLREKDRQEGAFSDLANYIWHNPVRACLVDEWRDWPHLALCSRATDRWIPENPISGKISGKDTGIRQGFDPVETGCSRIAQRAPALLTLRANCHLRAAALRPRPATGKDELVAEARQRFRRGKIAHE